METLKIDWRALAPYLVYALLALAVLSTLLAPGYVLTLDMVFGPGMDSANQVSGLDTWDFPAGIALRVLVDACSRVVPPWLVQKAILLVVLFLAGVGAHRLVPFKGIGRYFAGILYTINPFTYVRFMAGQWGVLGAYALTPFAVKAFLDLLEKGGIKNAARVALLSSLIAAFQIHGLIIVLVAFLVAFAARLAGSRNERRDAARTTGRVAAAGAMFLTMNLYWLLPALTASGTMMEQIGRSDLLFFSPRPTSSAGAVFDLAAMYGFWREGYTYAKDSLPCWWLGFAFIVYLAACGLMYKRGDRGPGSNGRLFGLLWLVGLVLAAGPVLGFARPAFEWLFDHSLVLRGFRDSQKFVALVCLAYSYLGALGITHLAESWRQQRLALSRSHRAGIAGVVIIALVIPMVYSYPMFGFHGELKSSDYPEAWYEANEYLNQDPEDFNVLFLPWHMYMDYDWLPNRDKRLANPAHHFFDKPVVCGDNIEAGAIYSQSANPTSRYVEALLERGDSLENLGELLVPLNVRYVVLVHEADCDSYDFLFRQQDLTVELDRENLTLFKNQQETRRVYAVDSVVQVDSIEEFLDRGLVQNTTEHVYVFGSGGDGDTGAGVQSVDYVNQGPAKYEFENTAGKYVVFTVPQKVDSLNWECRSSAAMHDVSGMPVFEMDGEGGVITYSRFYDFYRPGYAVSIAAILLIVAACLLRMRWTRERY